VRRKRGKENRKRNKGKLFAEEEENGDSERCNSK
jgi:hypothetical protein